MRRICPMDRKTVIKRNFRHRRRTSRDIPIFRLREKREEASYSVFPDFLSTSFERYDNVAVIAFKILVDVISRINLITNPKTDEFLLAKLS